MDNHKVQLQNTYSKKFTEILKKSVKDVPNNWNSKEREAYVLKQVSTLDFIKDGNFMLGNKSFVKRLKQIYLSNNPSEFSFSLLNGYFDNIQKNSVYILHEPFGSKASPDFLLLSNNGLLGIEDKSSRTGKITWNTGNPGGNKITMYFDRKNKRVFLLSPKEWGWTPEISLAYEKFKKEQLLMAKKAFSLISKFSYYARPMLIDENVVENIYDPQEKEVTSLLNKMFMS